MYEKIVNQILNLADKLTPEETARAAAALLDQADVNRDTATAFLTELGQDDAEELAAWVDEVFPPEE